MSKRWIPYARQSVNLDDVDAVVRVLQSPNLTQGPNIDEFERAVAEFCGSKYAVACSSATAALHIACLAAGLGEGDSHWTSPNTFVASANCGLYCGSQADFVDIDPHTYNMSVAALAAKLDRAKTEGRLPKVLIPVDFAGQSASYREIHAFARAHGITVIADASHAIGGSYLGKRVGSNAFSDMTVFSFHPVKIITSGEGGMVLTNREDLYEKLVRLRSHGITRENRFLRFEPDGPWSYEQLELGFNYRMTDLQAILGLSQVRRIDEFVKRRKYLVERYNALFAGMPVRTPDCMDEADPAWHLYVLRLPSGVSPVSRKDMYLALRERGIGTNVHYIPVHLQPYYRDLGFQPGQFPEAETYYQECLSLPLYFELTDAEQDHVVDSIREVLRA